MAPELTLDMLDDLKQKNPIKDITIFDWKGNVIATTQKNNFLANGTFYALISGAVRMISQGYNQVNNGVTIELEDTEFFFNHVDSDETEKGPIPIVGIEYSPGSINRDKRKEITFQINDMLNVD